MAKKNEKGQQSQAGRSRPKESSVDPPPRFKLGQRVVFYDKRGGKHYGTVRWTGKRSVSREFDYMLVGIQTVCLHTI